MATDGELAQLWHLALGALTVSHPNGRSHCVLRIIDGDPPQLYVGLDETTCTRDPTKPMRDFAISTVRLCCWPGEALARQWFSAAWVGYLQHEALELVTHAGVAVLDPHAAPYVSNAVNRGLRDGFPVELTAETMIHTLELVMSYNEAARLIHELWESKGYPFESRALQP